jgi:predicted AAA+ superfamily ATPase
VGKTTALHQIVEDLLSRGSRPEEILLIRFDLPQLREAGLLPLVRWHLARVKSRRAPLLLLDEVHKLRGWDEEVKHLFDTHGPRMVLTGSASVLVARGERESLAGRALTVEYPPFLFREVLEAWSPPAPSALPSPLGFRAFFDESFDAGAHFDEIRRQQPQRRHAWRRRLERYYNRGGYPRLYSGEVDDDRWADYLVETVFDRVLGIDIPDLFPVDQPALLRHVYLELARRTGSEVAQGKLAEACNAAGFQTSQPVVGRYIHYLADALLIREFRRFPLAKSRTARVPLKITLTDMGVRNAIFRGAPSLYESPPDVVGPLVETLVQTVLHDRDLVVHFYREHRRPNDRRSPLEEVDFVVENIDGTVVPVEVKYRKTLRSEDVATTRRFVERFESPLGVVVTRETFEWRPLDRLLLVPLLDFLLAF